MKTSKHYTKEELNSMVEMVGQGASYKELAEMFGRTPHAIEQKLNSINLGSRKIRTKEGCDSPASTEIAPATVKEKTLSDFTIREIINHLYNERNCRFRIRNNKVSIVVEREINLSDIING